VVTKKRRRSQLARATAERQQLRRAQRAARRRRIRLVVTTVVVVLLVAGLVAWILTHRPGSASTGAAGVDYARVVNHSHHQSAARLLGHATSVTLPGLLQGQEAA
jgi:hypothetical protein